MAWQSRFVPTRRLNRHRRMGAAAVVAALTLAVACGGDDDDDDSSGSDTAAPAASSGDSTASSGGTAPAVSTATSGGGDASGGLAAAQAATEENLQVPTEIGVTTPLNEKPETGGLFTYMQCDVNQCKDISEGLKAATEAIGWDFKAITYEGANPATLVAGLEQALLDDPTAVGVTGLPQAVWSTVIPAYQEAGVPIVTGYIGPQENTDPLIGQVGGSPDVSEYGEMIADWVVADSEATANVLLQSVNDYPVLKVFSDAFKAKVAAQCPDCNITEVNNTLDQLGTAVVPSIISGLQSDPSIKYVVTVNGPFITGLVSALAAAGLEDIKIAGESGDVTNLTNVKAGTESAFTGLALNYSAWLMVDIVLRHLQGIEYDMDGDGGMPKQLLTKDVDFEISNSYDQPADYADQFKKLWLVE